jgi:hypothetical protein
LLELRTGGAENANDVAVRVASDVFHRTTFAAMVVDRTASHIDERGAGINFDFPLVVRGQNVDPHF